MQKKISKILRNFNFYFVFPIEHALITSMHYGWVWLIAVIDQLWELRSITIMNATKNILKTSNKIHHKRFANFTSRVPSNTINHCSVYTQK